MRASVSAFRLFPTGDPSNNKGWWRFVCVDMFEMPPAKFDNGIALFTNSSIRINSAVCRSLMLIEVFPQI